MRGAELMSTAVEQLSYEHVQEVDVVRVHKFVSRAVELWALPDGSLLLRHRNGRQLWDEFEVVEA